MKGWDFTENIIKIKGGGYEALINLSRGANCISLKNSEYGADILRSPNYDAGIDNPYLYGMPILFPQNRISGGKFSFENRVYTFPINEEKTNCHLHGTLHNTPFNLVSSGESFVKCIFSAEKDEYLSFPHAFSVELEYSVSELGLSESVTFKNLSDENMPIFLGFHTTFNIPFISHGSVEDVTLFAELSEEIERDMSVYLPTGRLLGDDEITTEIKSGKYYPYKANISRHYKSLPNGKIELHDEKNGVRLIYENDEKYTFRLIYGGADGYICLEPLSSMANSQNSSLGREYGGFRYIKPGREEKFTSHIYLKKEIEI